MFSYMTFITFIQESCISFCSNKDSGTTKDFTTTKEIKATKVC